MGLRRQRTQRKPGRILLIFLLLLLAGGGGAAYLLFFEGNSPEISLQKVPEYIGSTDTLEIEFSDTGSGLKFIQVTASQDGVTRELYSRTNPRLTYTGQIGPLSDRQVLEFNAEKLGFKDGEIVITATAYDFSLRGMLAGNSVVRDKRVTLDTIPPKLRIKHSERYISPGGTGIVIYNVIGDDTKSHGVYVNGGFNKGFLVGDGRKDTYIAYFALPFDAESVENSKITAEDTAGNVATIPFSTTFKSTPQKHDRINISDGFLSAKIPEFEQYYPNLPGNLLEKYLYTNQTLRQENNKRIADLCSDPLDERLWEGRFLRMAGSGRARFADHRTYYYNNQPIDKQVHLGMDIASTRRANVEAANTGKVIFADYLGIYGHMVLLDHGQGVFSLYSHLSQINVAVDDMVARGDTIGLTGTSGMAGGDHLHFSMLINGVFVTPVEWWDPHWIEVTISEPLINSKF